MTTTTLGRPPSKGWAIVARKEFADHLLSVRFIVLLIVLGLVAAAAVYTTANEVRNVAGDASETPFLFLLLFTVNIEPVPMSFFLAVAFLAPLLGIAFGFDSINGERSRGTLPRLVSQPIYRDDVINGKFAAGLAIISVILFAVTAVVGGIGIFRLGITPSAEEVLRLLLWLIVTMIYVGIWLAFATFSSVALRRAATAALLTIAVWLVLAPVDDVIGDPNAAGTGLFWGFVTEVVADTLAPVDESSATLEEVVSNAETQQAVDRLSPVRLYEDASLALLNPEVRSVGVVTITQLDRAVISELAVVQSLLLVWSQVVGMVAATVVIFAVSYVVFMRQEIRA
ncbi:MAG: ABC transporter permease [Acidimicrobiia bacterium]